MRRSLIIFGVFCLASWGGKALYFSLTDGFSVCNITSKHADHSSLTIPHLSLEQAAELNRALSQEYTYLAKGNHSYVFESSDKQYVIKFLQFQKYRIHPIFEWLPKPQFWQEMLNKKKQHKEGKLHDLLKSWKIAYMQLREETQLVYVHLNRQQPFHQQIKLINKCGLGYQLDLNDYVFMLQKKVDLFASTLEKYLKENNEAAANQLMSDLIALYHNEYQLGIYEEDRYIIRNTGVHLGKPMHLDVDRFRSDPSYIEDIEKRKEQLLWKTAYLVSWLEKRYPHLAVELKRQLASFQP